MPEGRLLSSQVPRTQPTNAASREPCQHAQRGLPAASAINSLVQSASAASLREASPGAEADSGPERNSAAQSPDSASAATSGAAERHRDSGA